VGIYSVHRLFAGSGECRKRETDRKGEQVTTGQKRKERAESDGS